MSRYKQPFTLEQAIMLDIPVITAEIARLQNSLAHLRETQRQLQENIESEAQPDREILHALEENYLVISSQEERVSMLRLALEHKGFISHANPHYEIPPDIRPEQEMKVSGRSSPPAAGSVTGHEGLYL